MKRKTISGRINRQIIIVGDTASSFVRELTLGLREAARSHPDWRIQIEARHISEIIPLQPAAIIAQIINVAEEEALIAWGGITINFSGWLAEPRLPRVSVDNQAIGQLAAQHLLERGYRRLTAAPAMVAWFARERNRAFVEYAREHGAEVIEPPPIMKNIVRQNAAAQQQVDRELAEWADAMQKPIGLFCFSDVEARRYLESLSGLGITVPDQIGVVGVNDDELLCETCDPPLSSVNIAGEALGRTIADRLQMLFQSQPLHPHDQFIPPTGVRIRQSSETEAFDDPLVARIVRQMREHWQESITPAAILADIPASRRLIEMRFKKATGYTLGEKIALIRLDHAKRLLRETDLTITQVAYRCGYSTPQRLNESFHRFEKTSPKAFRQSQQIH